MIAHRKGRETALRMLFQWEMTRERPERVKTVYWEHAKKVDEGVREEADPLFDGVVGRVAEIDGLLEQHTENWRVERLSTVDRNILRMAVYEFLTSNTSANIIIDEAVEITFRYSTNDAAKFINGVLDAIRRALGKPSTVKPEPPV